MVKFSPHDILIKPGSDKYPSSIAQRVDRCVDMLAGIIDDKAGFSVGFPGRKSVSGKLEFQEGGFAGSHGSRHFFNMSGGAVHTVDMLFRRAFTSQESQENERLDYRELIVPSLEKGEHVSLLVPKQEYKVIVTSLDSVPWTNLSWSMHRGLRDVLLATGKPVMDRYRQKLASFLKDAVKSHLRELIAKGWDSGFVVSSMPQIVFSTVMAGSGDSGDAVRAMTDTALVALKGQEVNLDKTVFWRSAIDGNPDVSARLRAEYDSDHLSADTMIALVKFVALEWSQDLDYQMYHDLPMSLLLL